MNYIPTTTYSEEMMPDAAGNTRFELASQARYPVEGLEFFDVGRTGKPFYGGLGVGLLVEGDLDLKRVEAAIQRLYDDIDSTRVKFPSAPDAPLHYSVRSSVSYRLNVVRIDEGPYEERLHRASEAEYDELCLVSHFDDLSMHAKLYDLGRTPDGTHGWIVAFAVNHIIIDDQGVLMLLDQFMANYRGEPDKVVHAITLMDFHNYMNEHDIAADLSENRAYWRKEMEGYVPPSLHEDPDAAPVDIDPSEFAFELETSLIRRLALACQTTLPSLYMAALHVGTAAAFDVRDSAICMLTERRVAGRFWNTVVHGLMFMNNRMDIRDDEEFSSFARRTVLKMSENFQNLVDDACIGGAVHAYYTYVAPFRSPDLGCGLKCASWMPRLQGANAGYFPADMISVFESPETMRCEQMLDPSISFFTPNEIRVFNYGVKRCLECAIRDPEVKAGEIIRAVRRELKERGVIPA